MSHFSIEQFADMLFAEANIGLVDRAYVEEMVTENKIPPYIYDVRGKLLWTIARGSDGDLQFRRRA